MALQVSNPVPYRFATKPLRLAPKQVQELTCNAEVGIPDELCTPVDTRVLGSMSGYSNHSVGLPPGFGGWRVRSSYHLTPTEAALGELREKLAQNQYQVYLGWVNAQLKKRKEPKLIANLETDLADGTVLAELISVVAGERLEMISIPALHDEKVTNVNRVLEFMKTNRIPMHPILAEDIVSGNVRSIMRLILALAARYKPNTVRQTSHRAGQKTASPLSFIGYTQSAVTALADARRKASVVVPKPKKPSSLSDHGDMTGTASSELSRVSGNDSARPALPSSRSSSVRSSQSIPKSSSQDFGTKSVRSDVIHVTENDARYRDLVISYRTLETDHNELRSQYDHLQSVCDELYTETRILGKMLLSLKQLLEMEDSENADDFEQLSSDVGDVSLALADVAVLKNRLNLSEEICSDIKEDLCKTRNECLRLQGAEVGLHQRLNQQQKVQFDLKAELRKARHEIQFLQSSKTDLEKQLLAKDERIAELGIALSQKDAELEKHQVIGSLEQKTCRLDNEILKTQTKGHSARPGDKQTGQGIVQDIYSDRLLSKNPGHPVQRLRMNGHQATGAKVVYFVGRNEVPLTCSVDMQLCDVTLKDVKRLLNVKRSCRYQFRTHDPQLGFVKKEVSRDDAPVPNCDGLIMVWLEDEEK